MAKEEFVNVWQFFASVFLSENRSFRSGTNYQTTRMVLEKFANVGIEKTLDYFTENYGSNDFELYVVVSVDNEEEEEDLEADLWFTIENIFLHYEGKKLSPAEIENMVLRKGV